HQRVQPVGPVHTPTLRPDTDKLIRPRGYARSPPHLTLCSVTPIPRGLVLCRLRVCWRAVRPVRGVARESIALVGVVALEDGDLTRAEPHLRADAAARRAVGDSVLVVISAGCLGPVMLAKGNLAEARALGGRGAVDCLWFARKACAKAG